MSRKPLPLSLVPKDDPLLGLPSDCEPLIERLADGGVRVTHFPDAAPIARRDRPTTCGPHHNGGRRPEPFTELPAGVKSHVNPGGDHGVPETGRRPEVSRYVTHPFSGADQLHRSIQPAQSRLLPEARRLVTAPPPLPTAYWVALVLCGVAISVIVSLWMWLPEVGMPHARSTQPVPTVFAKEAVV